MKKLITSILAALTLCVASVPAFAEEAPPVPEPAANGPILWYHLTTGDAGVDRTAVAKIREVGGQMGYTSYISNLPRASALYDALPQGSISIIHGHGSPGTVYLNVAGEAEQLLTIYDGSDETYRNICNYSSAALSNNKLIMFFTCKSAALRNLNSLVDECFNKGAKCVIGFNRNVARAENWGKLFMEYSHNRVTIQEAINQANATFEDIYGVYDTSPADVGNMVILGNASQKLRVN